MVTQGEARAYRPISIRVGLPDYPYRPTNKHRDAVGGRIYQEFIMCTEISVQTINTGVDLRCKK